MELTKVKRIRSISFIQGTMVNTLRQVILFILMWLIFKDKMDAGQLVTMQIFSFFVFGPLQEIGNILLSYREAEASLNNFDTLMKKTPELDPDNPKPWAISKHCHLTMLPFNTRPHHKKQLTI